MVGSAATRSYVDVNPPYLFPRYGLTKLRAPVQSLVEVPHELMGSTPGPNASRIPVGADDSNLLDRHDSRPIGQPIILFGRVLDSTGRPVPGALLELWQTNGAGRYVDPVDLGLMPLDPNFDGAGRCLTDAEGKYSFMTVRPAPYPAGRGGPYRPAHIHLSIIGPDLSSRLITQCYFPDDSLLASDWISTSLVDPRALAALVATFRAEMLEPNGIDNVIGYEWDLVLRGRGGVDVEVENVESGEQEVLTPSQTIGPLYGYALIFDGIDAACAPAESESITISGTLFDGSGAPIVLPGGMLEIWEGKQFARARTGPEGTFRATLRRPSGQVGQNGESLAPHFNVTVFAQGLLKQAQTRLYFPEQPALNQADPVFALVEPRRQKHLVAQSGGPQNYVFDVHLQGNDEAVFFAY